MTARPVDLEVARLARRQHGRFSRGQVLAAGGDDGLIQRRLRAGWWCRVGPGVYAFPSSPDTFLAQVWAAHLAAGPVSVVSHQAAASLRRVTGFSVAPVTLLVPNGHHHRIRGATVHQTRDQWRPEWVSILEGLPVTSLGRTLVDLAAVTSAAVLAKALDDAVAARAVSMRQVTDCFVALARPGKPGIAVMARLLDDRGPGFVPAASTLERRLLGALKRYGEPAPVRQLPLPGRGAIKGFVDVAYPDARLIIEADGRRWHTRVADLSRDHLRDAEAARVGWQVLRVLDEHLKHDPAEVVRTIRDTRLVRLATLHPAETPLLQAMAAR